MEYKYNYIRILFSAFIIMLAMSSGVHASLVGTITTDKQVYNVEDPININFNIGSAGSCSPDTFDIIASGVLPTYNGSSMSQFGYFGRTILEGSDTPYFEHSSEYRVCDIPEPSSSFIPIPTVSGSIITGVSGVTLGDIPRDFLGELDISPGSTKAYITRQKPMILVTDTNMSPENIFLATQTMIISYFCQNKCYIKGFDSRNPSEPTQQFLFGLDGSGNPTLTTSDTHIFKQIVDDLSLSGYTPSDDRIHLVITDDKGNTDSTDVFIYAPSEALLNVDNNYYDIGTNFLNQQATFNNSMMIVYRTPDTSSEYRLAYSLTGVLYFYRLMDNIPAVGTSNGVVYISLDGTNNLNTPGATGIGIYNSFANYFTANIDKKTLSIPIIISLQQRSCTLGIFCSWGAIATLSPTFTAQRQNMIQVGIYNNPQQIVKPEISLLPVFDSVGFTGYVGHMIAAIIMIIVSMFILIRGAKVHGTIVLVFEGIFAWYLSYAGFLDFVIIALIVIAVVVVYVKKYLGFMEGAPDTKQEPPTG